MTFYTTNNAFSLSCGFVLCQQHSSQHSLNNVYIKTGILEMVHAERVKILSLYIYYKCYVSGMVMAYMWFVISKQKIFFQRKSPVITIEKIKMYSCGAYVRYKCKYRVCCIFNCWHSLQNEDFMCHYLRMDEKPRINPPPLSYFFT